MIETVFPPLLGIRQSILGLACESMRLGELTRALQEKQMEELWLRKGG